MRNVNKILGTSCVIFCLGGWVCNGSAIAGDSATGQKQAAIDAAVAAAAAPSAASSTPGAAAASPGAASATSSAASSTPGAAAQPGADSSTNLNSAVVNVGADGMVEQFNAQDLDINTALHFLSLQSKRNIIASKEVKGTVTANLYNVTFQEALNAVLAPNGFDYIEKGNFIYVYTAKELEDIRKRERKTVNRIYHLKYLTAQDASVLLKPLMSSSGIVALTPAAIIGLSTGMADTGGMNYGTEDTLVINDYPENLTEVDKALKDIDARPRQVLIESTILSATINEDNALGIDLLSLSGVNLQTLTGASATNLLPGASSSSTGSGSGSGTASTPVFGSTGAINNGVVNGSPMGNVGTDFASKVPQGGLSVAFLSNSVSVFVRALEEITDTTIVANPKILALNKHHGEVFIGQEVGYKTITTTQSQQQETVQFLDTGTKLVFRPFIGDDGYVRLEIHPEDSSPLFNNGLPGKQSTEVTSNVMIKDGRTIVIGGLFREQTKADRSQVPVIGNIPILGVPFRRTSDTTERKETIVLLTPHIINDDTSLYNESEKTAADVNRMMLGNRAGLQPWGRDRMAQLWYSKAQEALDSGNKDKALMYTDWALNTNHHFIDAIKFREQLTGKMVKEADESSLHSFVQNVIRDDKATCAVPAAPVMVQEVPATAPASK